MSNYFNMENSICIMLHNLLTLNKLKHQNGTLNSKTVHVGKFECLERWLEIITDVKRKFNVYHSCKFKKVKL